MSTLTASEQESVMPWWLVLIEGAALLILGFMLLTNTGATTIVAVKVIGIYWLIAGIFKIVSIFIDSSQWGLKLLAGIFGIIAGIIVLNHPLISPLLVGSALVIILGIQGIVIGVVGLIQGFKGAGWGAAVLGAISLIFGIILLTNLWVFTISLPWAIGILAIVGGIAAIIGAFKMR